MPEPPDDVDLILRTDAAELIRIALQCDSLAAEMHLIQHMAERSPDDWRARLRIPPIVAIEKGVRWRPSLAGEFAEAVKIRFWREALAVRDDTLIHVNGNLAAYRGPRLVIGESCEVKTSGGVIIPKDRISNILVIDTRRQAEAHLYAIRLRLQPLLEDLQRDGGHVGLAIDQLQRQRRLPKPLRIASRSAARQHWVEEALAKYPPRKGETRKHWAERATPNRAPSAQSWLARNPDVWAAHGGT